MCGIVGIVSPESVSERLLEGLKRLEYRGYDSSGIATVVAGEIGVRRAKGKLHNLQTVVAHNPLPGSIGIGHTRWATHGVPSEENAHPHASEWVAVVHNGIIENHAHLKADLIKKGYAFTSQTDTEVIVHLLGDCLAHGLEPMAAFQHTLAQLEGAFAIAVIFKDLPATLMVARSGSPLVIGYGDDEMFIGSDALSLAPWTQRVTYLDEGDYAVVSVNQAQIYDKNHAPVARPITKNNMSPESASKGGYRHYMLKEIFEQPTTISQTLLSYIDQDSNKVALPGNVTWKDAPKLTIVACGTSYYAGMVAKYWFEKYAHLPVEVDIASEFRYRELPLPAAGVAIFISQSGETIDTLTALNLAKEKQQQTLAIVNVPHSSIARAADHVIFTHAGPEIGVASTKAFTAQLAVLACLVIEAGRARGVLTLEQEQELVGALQLVPGKIAQITSQSQQLEVLAQRLAPARDALFLGRGSNYPIALEGALKLKEISYIHAEGYPAGELKHGPIALIDKNMPVLVVAPSDSWLSKTLSNVQEVIARGAQTICFTDVSGSADIARDMIAAEVVELPTAHPFVQPLLYVIPLQLLSYHTAVARGTDVDQPRNLAKSVTVE